MRRFLAALVMLAAAAPASAAGPANLWVGSSQRAVKASAPGGPLDGTLRVRRGHEVAFDFSRPARSVTAGAGMRPRRTGDGRRWIATVPRGLESGPHRVSVRARDGHWQFALRVIPRPSGKVLVPEVVGLTFARATRALERRGLCWRVGRDRGKRICDSGPPPAPGRRGSTREVRRQSIHPPERVRAGTVIRLDDLCSAVISGVTCD